MFFSVFFDIYPYKTPKMKKIYLTKEQFAEYTKQLIKESIVSEKDAGKFGIKKLQQVTDYLANKAASASDDDDILHQARANGINIDSLKGNNQNYQKGYDEKVQETVDSLLKEKDNLIKDWVAKYLPILRNSFSNKNMLKGYEEVPTDVRNQKRDTNGELSVEKSEKYFDTLDRKTQEEVWKLKDFLDKEGLTIIYRNTTKPKSIKQRYGMNINNDLGTKDEVLKAEVNWQTPIDDVLEALDFRNVTDSELRNYYTGTRVAWINAKLEKLGYSTEVDANGKPVRVDAESKAWGEAGIDIARVGKLKQVAERYVQRTYGMDFTFGDGKKFFSFGNKKIDDRTVIINFEAALRCPAWNKCLLKDACYARNSEKNYDNTLNRNLRTNLVWQQTKGDEQLTNLMLELVRSYIFNYDAAVKMANKNGYRGKFNKESLSKLSMAEVKEQFGDDVLDILAKTRRADVVRLNEDGDFIGQWLVDMWEGWAADFKLAGVAVAAYTCRALNYEKVSNMILNISQEHLVAGQNSPGFSHFFFAVEPEEYKQLDETYMKVTTDEYGSETVVPSDEGPNYNSKGQVVPMYRRLIDESGNLCGYYYKCPCGRLKPGEEDELNEVTMGAESDKVDCYRCRICYGRDADTKIVDETGQQPKRGVPVYVLVSVHGANKGEYEAERNIGKRKIKDWLSMQAKNKMQVREGVETEQNDPMAIKQIVKNTINSVVNMMRNGISRKNAISEINGKFNNVLKKLG